MKRLRARHRLILTGTPVQNRVGELWSLFDFLMPGFLAPSEAAFNSRFARPLLATRDPKASAQLQQAGEDVQSKDCLRFATLEAHISAKLLVSLSPNCMLNEERTWELGKG